MLGRNLLIPFLLAPALASGACRTAGTLRDFGLRRAWRVTPDCAHPERPATLVEIPWDAGSPAVAIAARAQRPKAAQLPPEVRCGMRVTVWEAGAGAEIRLEGTAMGTARRGEIVAVRAGLEGATLRGRVRGPGEVELVPREGVR